MSDSNRIPSPPTDYRGSELRGKFAADLERVGGTEEVLRALDAAIERCESAGWEPGAATARFVAVELGRDVVGVMWDHGTVWRPAEAGVARVARALKRLEALGLVAVFPGYPARYAPTPEGDELLAEVVA